jgi:hemerythrin-like domain-containing protein
MSRRHDALVPLTHDHHHALHNLRLLLQAADEGTEERVAAALAFAEFFASHSVQHFREEEEEIFPLVIRLPDAPAEGITRIVSEHVMLHALVRELREQAAAGEASPETMNELAALLRQHIRFEEDELFPTIERIAAGPLETVRLSVRDRS